MKSIIRFFTRFVPRKILQRFASFTLKIIGVLYKGKCFTDPVSGKSYRKLLPYGRTDMRNNALAPHSMSLERHRLIWLYLQCETDFFTENLKMLHVAPELCFIKKFKKLKNLDYITGDLESPWADIKMNVLNIPFSDNTFDVAMCNHVFEHIAEDNKAMTEFFRVLKPNGWAIFQVPIQWDKPTIEDFTITNPKEREKLFGQRDHVRLYGYDYTERLQNAGFFVSVIDYAAKLGQELTKKFALLQDEKIILCQKIL